MNTSQITIHYEEPEIFFDRQLYSLVFPINTVFSIRELRKLRYSFILFGYIWIFFEGFIFSEYP